MTFLRSDPLRVTASGAVVGGHLLDVQPAIPTDAEPRHLLRWQLRCGGCLALLTAGGLDLEVTGRLLVGALSVPATGGCPAVSWAYGTWPGLGALQDDRGPDVLDRPLACGAASHRVDVVFGRGLRRAVLAPAHHVADGMWVAAAPGRARQAVALSPGTGGAQRRLQQLGVPGCAGLVGLPK